LATPRTVPADTSKRELELPRDCPPLTIGGENSDLVVDARASACARITSEAGAWQIEPMGSGPRILVNERALAARRPLAVGDELRIGASVVHVQAGAAGLRLRFELPEQATLPPASSLSRPQTNAPPPGATAQSGGSVRAQPYAPGPRALAGRHSDGSPSSTASVSSKRAPPTSATGTPATVVSDVVVPTDFRPFQLGVRTARGAAPWSARRAAVLGAVSLGALSLLAAAWFAFTSVPVRVIVEPVPDALSLSGRWPILKLGSFFLLQPGEYTVEAELEGYELRGQSLTVERGDRQRFAFAMTRRPGRVSVLAEPEGASIFIDGERVGEAPLIDFELASGTHQLRLEAARYLDLEQPIEIQGGDRVERLELELIPNWAEVSIRTSPSGAELSIDGNPVGESPRSLALEAGAHTLRASLAGYKTHERELIVVARQPQIVPEIVLAQRDGRLRVVSEPAGASLTIDGTYRGKTPVEVEVEPGREHRLRLSKVGYRSVARELDVASAASEEISIRLTAELGRIDLRATPADAEVFVDGRSRGIAPDRIELSAEPHEIELRKEGFEAVSVRVTPRAGLTKRVELTMQPEPPKSVGPAQERPQRLADKLRTSLDQELVLFRSPGPFEMGSGRREQGRRSNETQRPVVLERSFYLGTREVTNREFRSFAPTHDSGEFQGVSLNEDSQPAVRVSWEQAVQFCNWLSAQESLPPAYEQRASGWVLVQPVTTGYRLPTEAEWAFAARNAGYPAQQRYPWGNALPVASKSGNYADKSADSLVANVLRSYDDGYAGTAPVGSFPPSPAGLYDVGGNVAEWVSDFYAIRPPREQTDPKGPSTGTARLIRGSSWKHASLTQLRLAYRDYGQEGREDVGFRIARYATEQ